MITWIPRITWIPGMPAQACNGSPSLVLAGEGPRTIGGRRFTREDLKHMVQCKLAPSSCSRCCYTLRQHRWARRCRLPSGDTWLCSAESAGAWGIGCRVCHRSGAKSAWARLAVANSVQLCNVMAHASSASHQKAVASFLGGRVPGRAMQPDGAPPLSAFQAVRTHTISGQALNVPLPAVGTGKKLRRMQYCLAEAKRVILRKRLASSHAIAIHQDARGKRLVVRFAAVTRQLRVLRGTLGQANHLRLGLVGATRAILSRFCTAYWGAPQSGVTARVNTALTSAIASKVEIFDADAAADEQAAGRALNNLFPNLKALMRDVTHASRRITKRPWAADPVLAELMDRVVFGRHSITRIIETSEGFKGRFQELVQLVDDNPAKRLPHRIRSLRAAKHRHESAQVPLARAVLYMDALLTLAEEILVRRRGEAVAAHALAFLEFIDERKLLLLALLADAGDEATQHLRFFDTERYDASEVARQCAQFQARIDSLFLQGRVLRSGYTRVMLDRLRAPRTFFLGQAQIKTIGVQGGIGAAAVRDCLAHLQAWVRLALETMNVEFPSWGLLVSFQVFDLGPAAAATVDTVTRGITGITGTGITGITGMANGQAEAFQRLAQAFDVDAARLQEQYNDVLPMALQLRRTTRTGNIACWREVLSRISRYAVAKRRHPLDALLPVFLRYSVFCGCTTSGIEQAFARQDSTIRPCRRAMLEATERDELQLLCDTESVPGEKLDRQAQRLWKALYAKARLSGSLHRRKRLDAGCPRKAVGSKTGWVPTATRCCVAWHGPCWAPCLVNPSVAPGAAARH